MSYKSSDRIYGTGLLLKIGGKDHWADCTKCELKTRKADKGTTTFADAANGDAGQEWYFAISAVQSTDPTSFWSWIWDHAGEELEYVYAPHGNATPSPAKPHFTGKVKIENREGLGGGAGSSAYDFETEIPCTETPTKVTTGGAVEGAGMEAGKQSTPAGSGTSSPSTGK